MYTPNEIIIDRAVEIWKRAVRNPTYDMFAKNDVTSDRTTEVMCASLATMGNKNNKDENVLQKFGEELKKILMTKNENFDSYPRRLDVDYHPCNELQRAAINSGLKVNFPIKTNMSIGEDSLSFTMGYAAPYVKHYPMPNGKWLLTDLSGEDVQHVIKHITDGTPLVLTIEG
jgi:hypothetical protein